MSTLFTPAALPGTPIDPIAAMNMEFIQETTRETDHGRRTHLGQFTGWETVVFEMEDEPAVETVE